MKAALIEREGSGLVLGEIPVPEAAAGEVRIRIIGTSVNFADVMMERGLYHSPRSRPFVLGMDAYGLVDARGEPGSGPPPGTPVVAFPSGSYAEYALVDARLLVPAPTGVSREALQGIGLVGCTAHELLTRAGGLRPGESVLVHAAAGGWGRCWCRWLVYWEPRPSSDRWVTQKRWTWFTGWEPIGFSRIRLRAGPESCKR